MQSKWEWLQSFGEMEHTAAWLLKWDEFEWGVAWIVCVYLEDDTMFVLKYHMQYGVHKANNLRFFSLFYDRPTN